MLKALLIQDLCDETAQKRIIQLSIKLIIHRVPPPMSPLLVCDRGQRPKRKSYWQNFVRALV